MGEYVPITERQARPLASLPPEQQRAAWTEAIRVSDDGIPNTADLNHQPRLLRPSPTPPQRLRHSVRGVPQRRSIVQCGRLGVVAAAAVGD